MPPDISWSSKPGFRRYLPRWQDALGVLFLALAAVELGFYSRLGSNPQGNDPAALPHPVFGVAEMQALAEAGTIPILDARNRAQYNMGHIRGAWSLPVNDFDAEYPKLASRLAPARDSLVIVYCSDMWCGLGDDLQKKLIDRGFHHVGRFPDGWEAWHAKGLPEETSK